MQKFEKRTNPRQSLQIPLRFRNVQVGSTDPELASETTNISRSGLFMLSISPTVTSATASISSKCSASSKALPPKPPSLAPQPTLPPKTTTNPSLIYVAFGQAVKSFLAFSRARE
jgi:hypothetical protein